MSTFTFEADGFELVPPTPEKPNVRVEFTPEELETLLSALRGMGTLRGAWRKLRDAAYAAGVTQPTLPWSE